MDKYGLMLFKITKKGFKWGYSVFFYAFQPLISYNLKILSHFLSHAKIYFCVVYWNDLYFKYKQLIALLKSCLWQSERNYFTLQKCSNGLLGFHENWDIIGFLCCLMYVDFWKKKHRHQRCKASSLCKTFFITNICQ